MTDSSKSDKTKKIQNGLILLLVVVVIVLGVAVFRMQQKLDTLGGMDVDSDRMGLSWLDPNNNSSPPNGSSLGKPNKDPFDIDNDWFSRPFDPNNWE